MSRERPNPESDRVAMAGRSHERIEYEAPPDEISHTVITAVADAANIHPTEIGELLYDNVDPDALDSIFDDLHDGSSRSEGHVSLTLDGHDVVVRSDRTVVVRPPAGANTASPEVRSTGDDD